MRQDLVYAKAAGFNTVRFIAGVAREDQLGFLRRARPDGLRGDPGAVAAGGFAPGWASTSTAPTTRWYRRDRNHPSVVIWGLLNETYEGRSSVTPLGYLPGSGSSMTPGSSCSSSGRWDGDSRRLAM